MNKLIFIGPFANWSPPTNGETSKNQALLKRCTSIYDKVYPIDTTLWKRNPLVLANLFIFLLCIRKANVIIAICDKSAYYLIRFLYYIRLQKSVTYFVIGGGLADKIENGLFKPKYYSILKSIVVEGESMNLKLVKLGLRNTRHIPNLKKIYKLTDKHINTNWPIRFVFMSRIEPTKGCNIIFEAMTKLNTIGYEDKYNVDFYGTIDEMYYRDFHDNLSFHQNSSYRGFLNLTSIEGYELLQTYDVMLFPTFYQNEGFPGVLVDASICGLPVIASDWHLNSSIIKDRYNGYMIAPNNIDALFETMLSIIHNPEQIVPLSQNSRDTAKMYDVDKVITFELLSSLGCIN